MGTDDSTDMQVAFKEIMKIDVAPVMREMGFKGSGGRFRCVKDGFSGFADVQRSRWNSKVEVEFTFNLGVSYELTDSPIKGIWGIRLGRLVSGRDFWWKLDSPEAVPVVRNSVVAALCKYGIPAVEVVLADPVVPPTQGELTAKADATRLNTPQLSGQERHMEEEARRALSEHLRGCGLDECFSWQQTPIRKRKLVSCTK